MDSGGTGRRRALAEWPAGDRLGRIFDLLLVAEFTFVSFLVYIPLARTSLGVDASSYWLAAKRWLAGLDPYAPPPAGLVFAAPPPTLAAIAPFALLPEPAFKAVVLLGSLLAAIYLIRKLGLPWWFLLFPPMTEALVIGNPNIIVIALLVAARPAADVAASFLKLYAILPIALLDRRRSGLWVLAALLVTAPLLPWPSFIAHGANLLGVLMVQSSGGRSALVWPVLVPFTVFALVALGRKRAAWLVVPALWPATQQHYNVLALPASSRVVAAVFALPIPGAPAVGVIMEALAQVARRGRAFRTAEGET